MSQVSIESNSQSKGTILLIDDSADIRNLFELLGDLEGVDIQTAENGKAALEKLEKMTKRPSLILVDLNMPVMNGRDLIHELRERALFPDAPVAVMTGEKFDLQNEDNTGLDVNAVLPKPFSVKRASEFLHRYLDAKPQ